MDYTGGYNVIVRALIIGRLEGGGQRRRCDNESRDLSDEAKSQ